MLDWSRFSAITGSQSIGMNADRQGETLRGRIRADLPSDIFSREPARALWFAPLVALIAVGTWTIIVAQPAWYLALPLAFVMGHAYAAMGFLAHEALHGSLVRSRRLAYFLGALGLGPFLVSPALWLIWHVRVHHSKTNHAEGDPDTFGTLEHYDTSPETRFITKLAPGSRHPASALFFAYWFTFHGQLVLWLLSKRLDGFEDLDRRRAIAETFGYAACWIALATAAGAVGAIYVVVIPHVIANALVMSYIATNHLLRPLSETDDPLTTAMSVRNPAWIERLHFRFGLHVEHHLFPTMSAKHAPAVRAWIERHAADRYVAPPHRRALAALYETPRAYADARTLCDPYAPDLRSVPIDDLESELRQALR